MRRAEELGFDGIYLVGGLQQGMPDPLPLLGYAAAATTTMPLGLAVLISTLRTPLHVARAVQTAEHISGGRVVLGLSLGHGGTLYERHGIAQPSHRGQHFERNIAAIRAFLCGEPVTLTDGPLHLVDEPPPLPPARPGGPPLWLGGRAPGALRRAARLGDGWLGAGNLPFEDFYAALSQVQRHLGDAGRDPDNFTVAKRVFVGVGPDRSVLREKLGSWFAMGPGDPSLVDGAALYGSATEVADGLRRLREAGTEKLILTPLVEVDAQMEILAAEVCPLL